MLGWHLGQPEAIPRDEKNGDVGNIFRQYVRNRSSTSDNVADNYGENITTQELAMVIKNTHG